jgi:hypothetical protein
MESTVVPESPANRILQEEEPPASNNTVPINTQQQLNTNLLRCFNNWVSVICEPIINFPALGRTSGTVTVKVSKEPIIPKGFKNPEDMDKFLTKQAGFKKHVTAIYLAASTDGIQDVGSQIGQ